ncbi:Bug family tripartite tricarboxylate transporter substrate binding protein [Bordetella sp. 2513F-2]
MVNQKLTRRAVSCLGTALACIAISLSSQARAEYPDRPIQLIVPYSVGGPTDVAARVMAQELSQRIGQNIVVMSMPGAGGVIGTEYVNRAKPDGYTLLFAVNSMAIFPHTRSSKNPLPFDPNGFAAVGSVAESAHVIVANKNLGIKSIAELVEAAKNKPDSLSFGSAGVGGTTHLPIALFAHRAGIKLLHVPYKGAAPAMADTMAGVVSISGPGYTDAVKGAIDNGTLVALSSTSAKRLPFLPNVPTLAEQGYPDMVFPIWYALFAPGGTPGNVVEKLNGALKAMASDTAYQAQQAAQGNVVTYMTPTEVADMLKTDIAKLGVRLKDAGINLQE